MSTTRFMWMYMKSLWALMEFWCIVFIKYSAKEKRKQNKKLNERVKFYIQQHHSGRNNMKLVNWNERKFCIAVKTEQSSSNKKKNTIKFTSS